MNRDALPDVQCPQAGSRVYGTISQVNPQMGYGFVAYRDNPEFQFIFPMHLVQDARVGREAVFILNQDLTVDQMALKPEPVRTPQANMQR